VKHTILARARLIAVTTAFIIAASTSRLAAAPITWTFVGDVVQSNVSGVSVLDAASLVVTYESTTTDVVASPSCGVYYGAIQSATAQFGSHQFTYQAGLPLTASGIEVQQGNNSGCGATGTLEPALTFRMFGARDVNGFDGTLIAYFEHGLRPPASDALPLTPTFWVQNSLSLGFRWDHDTVPQQTVLAWTDRVTVVPEPVSAALFGIGLLAWRWRRSVYPQTGVVGRGGRPFPW